MKQREKLIQNELLFLSSEANEQANRLSKREQNVGFPVHLKYLVT